MTEFNWPLRVYYEDTDAGGVVYHSQYLNFFERARSEMLRSFGFELDQIRAEHELIFVVRHAHVDFLKPARFNDQLQVISKIIASKRTNFTFEQQINRQQERLCIAEIRIACIHAQSFKPQPIPTAILDHLS